MITKKLILDTIAERHGVKREYLALHKEDGFYYWGEKAAAVFTETCIYITRLNDFSLDRWVSDFDSKMQDTIARTGFSTLNDYIESIDWRL